MWTLTISEAVLTIGWLAACWFIWCLIAEIAGLGEAIRSGLDDHLGADLRQLSRQIDVSSRFASTDELAKAVMELMQEMARQREMLEPQPIPAAKVVSIAPEGFLAETDEGRE